MDMRCVVQPGEGREGVWGGLTLRGTCWRRLQREGMEGVSGSVRVLGRGEGDRETYAW